METDSACFQANAMQSTSLAREKLTQLWNCLSSISNLRQHFTAIAHAVLLAGKCHF